MSTSILSRFGFLIHSLIGGVMCLFLSLLLYAVMQGGVESLLNNSGTLGVLGFDETISALGMLAFGLVFLPSGFLGGLYGGSKNKERLRIVLGLPGAIGFVAYLVMSVFSSGLVILSIDWLRNIAIPLVGDVLGSYLGGYLVNWPPKDADIKKSLEEMEKPSSSIPVPEELTGH